MSNNVVSKVDLLDINREPTDAEMEAIMQDMVNHANAKWKRALNAYMTDLFEGIEVAARKGAEKARLLQPYLSPTRDNTLER